MKIAEIKPIVYKLLTEHAHLRDDDLKLIANIWYNEMDGKQVSAFDFLSQFSRGEYSNPESIRRVRQKLQEENPDLRGENYQARQSEQKKVKSELGYA